MTVLNIDMKPFETVEKIYIKSSCNINNFYLFQNSWKFLYANDFQLILISHVFERAIFEFVVEKSVENGAGNGPKWGQKLLFCRVIRNFERGLTQVELKNNRLI